MSKINKSAMASEIQSDTSSATPKQNQVSNITTGPKQQSGNQPSSGSDSSVNQGQRSGNRPWCDHCKIPGHTKEVCWKIHGKPPGRQSSRPSGHAAAIENSVFSKEQAEALQRMMQDTIQFVIGGSSMAAVAQSAKTGLWIPEPRTI